MCSRLINLPLNLESGRSDVDPGTLPLLRELTHMWLFVSTRAMVHQLVDFMWTNGGDVWCQFSFFVPFLLSQLGAVLVTAPSCGFQSIHCCSTISGFIREQNMSLEALLWSQDRSVSALRDCVWTRQVFKHGAWTRTQPAVLLSVRPPCLLPATHKQVCLEDNCYGPEYFKCKYDEVCL